MRMAGQVRPFIGSKFTAVATKSISPRAKTTLRVPFLIMNAKFRRTAGKASLVVASLALLAGCSTQSPADTTPTQTPTESASPTVATTITYSNTLYGFTFTLPMSWTGYTVVNNSWSGTDTKSGKTVQSGSLILLRNPLWTDAKKMQDIPIMVFTIGQWDSLIHQDYNVGAAPIPPSEMGRNAQFVFALPARYNYAFPAGYQEVETILAGKPLHTS